MTAARVVEILVVIALFSVFLSCLGAEALVVFVFYLVFQILCGWAIYLARVVPQMSIDPAGVVTAVVCLVALSIGLHLFLRWLYSGIQEAKPAEQRDVSLWRLRWTGTILMLIVLLFTAGIASVGIAHQSGWLFAGPDPIATIGSSVRIEAGRMMSMNRLKQIGLALHNYADEGKQDSFPPGVTFDAHGNALHGWQTQVLPYIEEDVLFRQIDQKAPWSDPRNIRHFGNVIKIYLHPDGGELSDEAGLALTHYASNVRVLGAGPARTFKSITDGTGNTILAGEVWAAYRPWGQPGNWRDPADGILTTATSFGSPTRNAKGAMFVMVDGSVRHVNKEVSRETLKALSTPDGGEELANDW